MGNALRLFVFCLALVAVGSTATLAQLWVRKRAEARQQRIPAYDDLQAYKADQQKAIGLIVVISFGSLVLVALAGGGSRRSTNSSVEDLNRSRSDMQQVEHLARSAIVREEALRLEREERQRADENLHIQHLLLNQALGEKVRIGRDLHDGVIQSLYATGLTLESSRQKRATDPAAAEALFERGVQLLNENIREIRGYINSLSESEALTRHGFSNALAVLIENAKGGRSTEFIVRIDEAAEARLSPSQIPDILQIVREAISNALRHGAASQITVRLHEDGDRLALLVADNGTGFNTATVSHGGNGIANFRARAVLLNAELRLDSQPGDGSRLVITFPTLPLA
jgi:signal transduction histidine kinase